MKGIRESCVDCVRGVILTIRCNSRYLCGTKSLHLEKVADMSCGEEQPECPLCMEPFDIDDVSFYPCTCGYQICRFCWHRIRTNENGLCPACRKAYPEDPAEFKPLTDDDIHRIKKDRRQKESQRKQKSAENRKHLTNVRVVQKNLVFVVGLSPRLCDAEILRRHEYFGRFGKIHKVVINQSTSYVGSQGPSASAYVTYFRPEDALAAIRTVNNLQIDGRTLKASLGTTKYCSHFLKGTQCMKSDCMYLHDYGDELASFSKEEIQQGKHLVYEQKLHEQFGGVVIPPSVSPDQTSKSMVGKLKDSSPPSSGQLSPDNQSGLCSLPVSSQATDNISIPTIIGSNGANSLRSSSFNDVSVGVLNSSMPPVIRQLPFGPSPPSDCLSLFSDAGFPSSRRLKPVVQQNSNDGLPAAPQTTEIPDTVTTNSQSDWQLPHGVPTNNSSNSAIDSSQDDDLGFDPWDISARALADLIEKEKVVNSYRNHMATQVMPPPPLAVGVHPIASMNGGMPGFHHSRLKVMPPGFTPNGFPPNLSNLHQPVFPHMAALHHQQRSRMLGMMQSQPPQDNAASPNPGTPPQLSRMSMPQSFQSGANRSLFMNPADSAPSQSTDSLFYHRPPVNNDVYMWRDWQEGLKALLPNVNISFGNPPHNSNNSFGNNGRGLGQSNGFLPSQAAANNMHGTSQNSNDRSWCSLSTPDLTWDPAIINSGDIATADHINDETPPHWMASLHHLTEDNAPHTNNHHSIGGGSLFAQSSASPSASWFPHQSSRLHPPGFGLSSPTRPGPTAATEAQLFGERQLSAS